MSTEDKKLQVYIIDACRDEGGWYWNQWFKRGTIPEDVLITTNRKLLSYLRKEGFISFYSKGRVALENDGINIVVMLKSTRQPFLAIEYRNVGFEG